MMNSHPNSCPESIPDFAKHPDDSFEVPTDTSGCNNAACRITKVWLLLPARPCRTLLFLKTPSVLVKFIQYIFA